MKCIVNLKNINCSLELEAFLKCGFFSISGVSQDTAKRITFNVIMDFLMKIWFMYSHYEQKYKVKQ